MPQLYEDPIPMKAGTSDVTSERAGDRSLAPVTVFHPVTAMPDVSIRMNL